MNYYMVRYECDTGCGEIEDVEPDQGMPSYWEKVDGEELCEGCARLAKEKLAKEEAS